jgi:hypothetical protein
LKNNQFALGRLILVGHRKNYVVQFRHGLNIIYGDSATGKSSILECVNYLLGSSKLDFDVEIEAAVAHLALEIVSAGQPYLIKRDIFNPARHIEVYPSTFEGAANHFPKLYVPSYKQPSAESGYFSDFLLELMGIAPVKLRTAPSKDDSGVARLSFRDIFKFCYLRQDDVGAKNILNAHVPVLSVKTRQTFKYIFNLLDESLAALEAQSSDLRTKKKRLETKYSDVSDFLRQTDFRSSVSIDDEINALDEQIEVLEHQLSELNQRYTSDTASSRYLRELLEQHKSTLAMLSADRQEAERQIERFVRLRNDYQEDMARLAALQSSKSLLGTELPEGGICPVCDKPLELSDLRDAFDLTATEKVTGESLSLGRRIKEVDQLAAEERHRLQSIIVRQRDLNDEYDRASSLLDQEVASQVSPYLAERDGISAGLATLKERKNQTEHAAKIRRLQHSIFEEIEQLAKSIGELELKAEGLRAKAPSLHEILMLLADELNKYLGFINIRDRRGVGIDEQTLLPVLRGREYRSITSGGLRTILSVGYFLVIAKLAASGRANMPPLLMIDTVGKYLGKTNAALPDTDRASDEAEGVTDPLKYQHMYEYMARCASDALAKNEHLQILVVDNDIPQTLQRELDPCVVARFSSIGEDGLPIGLIDDARIVTDQ